MTQELRERVALLFRTMYATEADRRIAADAAIAIIRGETLEEAAKAVETCRHGTEAAAIRALAALSGALKEGK